MEIAGCFCSMIDMTKIRISDPSLHLFFSGECTNSVENAKLQDFPL